LTSALTGENYLFGLEADWGISYADSKSEFPYDFEMDFEEPSIVEQGVVVSGMRDPSGVRKGPLENITDLAVNNFSRTYLYSAYYRGQESNDNEKTAFLNLSRNYTLGRTYSGEVKIGGKYRDRSRDRALSELFSPYYIEPFSQYTSTPNGIVRKDFTGTRFEHLQLLGINILMTNFLDTVPVNRDIFSRYSLYPVINRDAIRLWWELNRNGYTDAAGRNPEYERNGEPDALYYGITERVSAAYVMNTFNFGQSVTLISGIRMEHESNDYASKYSSTALSGFPVPKGAIRDTSAAHQETVWLPNFHLTYRPLEFMNIRVAAYRALARPDFNHRLASFTARFASTFFPGNSLYAGNTQLKAAKAWNYELNTSIFSNKVGLLSVSAFYKDVEDMFHLMNGLPFKGQGILDSLGIGVRIPFSTAQYSLTFPYNSTRPTRVWGFEFEHQTNLRFLPGFLSNFVLSYNFSFIRSETYVPRVRIEKRQIPGIPIPQDVYIPEENKQKLEGQPEFFGNFAIGYDIGGLSARVSVFHQGEFYRSFSVNGRSDGVVDAFTRWDLAVKQRITDSISLLLNVNNFTDADEGTSILNNVQDWDLLNTSETFGLTADLGLRLNF
jgi:TonB-dependent receptor